LVVCLVALACGDNSQTINPAGVHREILDAWLLCHDCTDGELDSLAAFGKQYPVAVVESLSTDLLAGPSSGRRANIDQQLEKSFTEDTAYEGATGGTVTMLSAEFIQVYSGNYVAVYRARAAIGLGRIGGDRARATLDSAIAGHLRPLSDSLRPDVRVAVRFARDSLWAP
jgi:hypothetical protein